MSDTSASIPPSDDPKPQDSTEAPAEAGTEGEENEAWGWDAETTEYDEGVEDAAEEPTETPESVVTDNSDSDTPPPAEPAPAPSPSGLPAGFKSWQEVLAVAQRAVATPPAPAAKLAARLPSLPFDDDPSVKQLASQVQNAPPEQQAALLQAMPGEVGARVVQRLTAANDALNRLRSDPIGFAREIADATAREVMESSAFAERFRKVEDAVYRQRGQQFLQEHKLSSHEQADLAQLLEDGVRPERAVQIVVQQRELKNLKSREGRVSSQQRQIEANKAASRAQQGSKGRGRVPDSSLKSEFKAAGTDVVKLAKLAERQLRERGQ